MNYTESDFLETADATSMHLTYQARKLTKEYYLTDFSDLEKRTQILKKLLGHLGNNVSINVPFHCDHGKNIFIGDNVAIGMNCTFVDNQEIHIGNQVMIAPNVQIYTASHPVLPQERFVEDWKEKGQPFFRTYAKPVIIEDNVWIGGGAILLPGVTIGKNTVIGSGSVVTHSISENCVAVGNPCKVLRTFA